MDEVQVVAKGLLKVPSNFADKLGSEYILAGCELAGELASCFGSIIDCRIARLVDKLTPADEVDQLFAEN